jgi:hypothetical protein
LSIKICFKVFNAVKRVHEAQGRRGRKHVFCCILYRMRMLIAWESPGLSTLLYMCSTAQCSAMPYGLGKEK